MERGIGEGIDGGRARLREGIETEVEYHKTPGFAD